MKAAVVIAFFADVLTGQVTARLVFEYSPVSAETPVTV